MDSIISELKKTLSNGEADLVIQKLMGYTENIEGRLHDDCIILKNRFKENEKNYLAKNITQEDYDITRNKVNVGIINLINDLKSKNEQWLNSGRRANNLKEIQLYLSERLKNKKKAAKVCFYLFIFLLLIFLFFLYLDIWNTIAWSDKVLFDSGDMALSILLVGFTINIIILVLFIYQKLNSKRETITKLHLTDKLIDTEDGWSIYHKSLTEQIFKSL